MVLDLGLRPEEEVDEGQQLLLDTLGPIRPIGRRTEWVHWSPEECLSHRCHLQPIWWWLHPNVEVEVVEVVLHRKAVCWWVVVEVEDAVTNVALASI